MTPEAERDPKNEAGFCGVYLVDRQWPSVFRRSLEFQETMARALGPGRAQDLQVMNAVLENALNMKRDDQAVWMKRYEAMRGLALLWPD